MKIIITATAPTVYQLNSLKSFGMGCNPNGNGSYSAEREFVSDESAKEYLKSKADEYNSDSADGSDEKLNHMYSSIKRGLLTLDAVTAYINHIDE